MSRIDFVIPCYQYGRFLNDCVESILAQSVPDFRILIIDDASSDETSIVGRELARRDRRVEFRCHSTNQGHIATYNEGLAWTEAPYTWLLSADDLLTPGAISRVLRCAAAHPEIGLMYGRDLPFRGSPPVPAAHDAGESCDCRILFYDEFLERSSRLGHTEISAPTALMRTDLQKRVGGFRRDLPHSGDTEIWLRLAAHAPVGVIDAVQAFRRLHPDNMSLGYSPVGQWLQHRRAFEIHFREYGPQIPNLRRLEESLSRAHGENAFYRASVAFDAGDLVACRECLTFASRVYPPLRKTRDWRRFQAKCLLGPRFSSLARAVLR